MGHGSSRRHRRAAAAAVVAAVGAARRRLGSLLGTMPEALDVVHRALAERRRVRIVHDAEEKDIEPALLTVQNGRWFVIARFVGADGFYGWGGGRGGGVGLGEPMTDEITPPDPLSVVDN